MSVARSMRVAVAAALFASLAATGLAAPVAAAANNTTVDVSIGSCDIRGDGGPRRGTFKFEWRAADGTLREASTIDSDFGYWGNDIFACFDSRLGVQPGDTIKTTVKGISRTFTVPLLTVRVNRDTDVVHGTAKPGGKVIVWLDGKTWQQRRVRVRSDGSYVADFKRGEQADIIGWDRVEVAWTNKRGDYVRDWTIAPGVQVTIGSSWIEAAGKPGRNAQLTLRQSIGGPIVARTGGVLFSKYNAYLWLDAHGNEVTAAEGNKVVTNVARHASFVIPTLTTLVNKKTDVVRLETGLGAGVGVEFFISGPFTATWATAETDASGSVVIDFTGDGSDSWWYDIVRGTRIQVTLQFPTGDEVVKEITVA